MIELFGDLPFALVAVSNRELAITAADRETGQGIIIALRNGVEFVVVATSAGHGHSQEGFTDDVQPVVDPIGFFLANVDRRMDHVLEQPKAGSQNRLVKTFAWM